MMKGSKSLSLVLGEWVWALPSLLPCINLKSNIVDLKSRSPEEYETVEKKAKQELGRHLKLPEDESVILKNSPEEVGVEDFILSRFGRTALRRGFCL